MSRNDKAYQLIRKMLLTGELLPNSKINDIKLAENLKMSRTPVREAIIRLSNEGFCHQIPRMGTYVCSLNEAEYSALYDFRVLLEMYAIAQAVDNISPKDLEYLQSLCDVLRKLAVAQRNSDPSVEEVRKEAELADVKFHLHIAKIAANPFLLKTIDHLSIMTHLCGMQVDVHEFAGVSLLKESAHIYLSHKRILRGLKKRDAEYAMAALKNHLLPKSDTGGKRKGLYSYTKFKETTLDEKHIEIIRMIKDAEQSTQDV